MEINRNLAEIEAKKLFKYIGVELDAETPSRFVKMLIDLTKYQNISNKEIANIVCKVFDFEPYSNSQNMVIIKNIETFSLCKHHIALIYDMKVSIAYYPKKSIIGISKIVRAVKMVCKRLTLQEKIGMDILEIMHILSGNDDIAVHICAKHSCVTTRGIENVQADTVTTHFSGKFLSEDNLKSDFLNCLK